MDRTVRVFVSYSHQDARYLERGSLLWRLAGSWEGELLGPIDLQRAAFQRYAALSGPGPDWRAAWAADLEQMP